LNAIAKLLSSEDERREDCIRESRSSIDTKVRIFPARFCFSDESSIHRSRGIAWISVKLYDNAVTFSSRVLAFLAVALWSPAAMNKS